jgi:hypothetical protein
VKALTHLSETILHLVDQGDEYVLVLRCRDLDVPIVHKVIEQVDQQSSDVFLCFAAPFMGEPEAWLDDLIEDLDVQIRGFNVLRKENGLEPWATLPGACFSADMLAERLASAFDHVHKLFPKDEDYRVLWAFVPSEIRSPKAWATVVGWFLPKAMWRAGHRVVVRGDDAIVEAIRRDPEHSALLLDVDFSPEAMANDLAARASDPATPPTERHLSLLQLAGLDVSHKRHAEAAKKYAAIYAFFDGMADTEGIRATCLMGVAMVAGMHGDKALSKKRYQQALALSASKADTLHVAMICCGSLGDLCHDGPAPNERELERRTGRGAELEEALGYYDLASLIAGKLCNVQYKVDLLRKIGDVLVDMAEPAAGWQKWQEGLALAIDIDDSTRTHGLLHRLEGKGA